MKKYVIKDSHGRYVSQDREDHVHNIFYAYFYSSFEEAEGDLLTEDGKIVEEVIPVNVIITIEKD